MRKWTILGILALTVGLFISGCCSIKSNCKGCDGRNCNTVTLCDDCGEITGSDVCCQPEGREICDDCGKYKGSPGCCAPAVGEATLILCDHCGEEKNTEACCQPEGRVICDDCGKYKGSPGCCY